MDYSSLPIKVVAIYLRKSRGEEDTDLTKHRNVLVEICMKCNWQYVEYAEIGTSDSIDFRPQMIKLLGDIEAEHYDAVLVVDYDRLGRGDLEEQARIKRVFSRSSTFIITPSREYDLNNESDDFFSDVQGMFARQEYRMIKKRLRQGKREGAKLGKWTNGSPPMPYIYDQAERKLIVDETQLKIYRYIIDRAFEGVPSYEIAWDLNRQGTRTRKNNLWSGTTIYRLSIDETHLGRIVSNKTEGSGHKAKKPSSKPLRQKPREEWIVVENCHQPVKTLEEHNQIKYLLSQRKKIPCAARAGKHPLSGLVKCGLCGHLMQIQKKKNASNSLVKKCQHADPYGNLCSNRGGPVKFILDFIVDEISLYEQRIRDDWDVNEGTPHEHIKLRIDTLLREINKKETALERIDYAYEEGAYDLQKWNERREKVKGELDKLESERDILDSQLNSHSSLTNEDKLQRIESFKDTMRQAQEVDSLNSAYKSIIDNVVWKRVGDHPIEMHVNFL